MSSKELIIKEKNINWDKNKCRYHFEYHISLFLFYFAIFICYSCYQICSTFGAIIALLCFSISFFPSSMKLALQSWSSGNRWSLQYEHSHSLHLNPRRPIFLLHEKHLPWSACLGGTGDYGFFNVFISYCIFYELQCYLNKFIVTCSKQSTWTIFKEHHKTYGISCT